MNLDVYSIACFRVVDDALQMLTKGHRLQQGGFMPTATDRVVLTMCVPVHRGFIPFLASCTPPLVDTMFRDLDWRGRHIDDLP
jgi:hypothetical protein